MKEIEIIIRTQADVDKIEELKAAGWKVLNSGVTAIEGEPDRVFHQLVKECEASK